MGGISSQVHSRGRAGVGDLVDPPGGDRHGVLVGGVAPPEALDQDGGRVAAPDHVLLSLLLLHLERQARAQDALPTARRRLEKRQGNSRGDNRMYV